MASTPSDPIVQIAISDLRSCERWLEQAPLADPQHALEQLRTVIGSLPTRRLASRVRFDILERLREPALATCEERTKRFAGRALPLRPPEAEALAQVVDLLRELREGYHGLLVEGAQQSFSLHDRKMHWLAGRCLETTGEIAVAYYRARQEVPGSVWKALHEVFALAERKHILSESLTNEAGRADRTCKGLYARAVLLQTARPYGLAGRELELAQRWIRGWAEHVELQSIGESAEGLLVDVLGDAPPAHRSVSAEAGQSGWRLLDYSNLKRSVHKRIGALRRGASPMELGLGRDCPARTAEALLTHLYNAWFSPPHVRRFVRRAVRQDIDVMLGFASIHAVMQSQPAGESALAAAIASETDASTLTWKLLEDSPAGFRVRRPEHGERLAHLQLVAIRPPGSAQYILTETRWLMLDLRNTTSAGLQALPGLARAAFARVASTTNASDEPLHRVFVLSDAKSGQSLIVPPATFLEGCFIELLDAGRTQRLRIAETTRQGADYECVSLAALL